MLRTPPPLEKPILVAGTCRTLRPFVTGVLLFLPVLVVASCGLPRRVIGAAFVIGDKVTVHSEPKRGAPVVATLARNERINIVKKRIEDRALGSMTFWYGVRLKDGRPAYLSYDEELVRSAITTIEPVEKTTFGLVTAEALHLRAAPGVTAKSIQVLKRNTVIEITGESSARQKIGEDESNWMEVRSPQGPAYVFAAHIEKGTKADLEDLARNDYRRLTGWAFLREDAVVHDALHGARKRAEVETCGSKPALKPPTQSDYVNRAVGGNLNVYSVKLRTVDLARESEQKPEQPARANSPEGKKTDGPSGDGPAAATDKGSEAAAGACAALYIDPKLQEEAEGKAGGSCRRYFLVQGQVGSHGEKQVAFLMRDGGVFRTVGIFQTEDIPQNGSHLSAPFSKRFHGRRERALKFERDPFVEVDAKKTGVNFKKHFRT